MRYIDQVEELRVLLEGADYPSRATSRSGVSGGHVRYRPRFLHFVTIVRYRRWTGRLYFLLIRPIKFKNRLAQAGRGKGRKPEG